MASMIFSDEEAKYLRAVLKWQEKPPDDKRASWFLGLRMPEKKPVGEFRVLVIGAKGVGKTSILKKFCTGVFPDPSSLATSGNINGCRRNITIESNEGKQVESNLYTVDALELPIEHLSSPEHLSQALAITDAAVLVYDITEPASLTYLKSLANNIYTSIHPGSTATTPTKKKGGFHLPGSPTRRDTCDVTRTSKPYHFLLIGAKRDVSDPLREVTWLEGQIAAEEFFGPSGIAAGASVGFMEVSARTGEQVGAIFPSLGREVLKSRRERQASSSQKYLLSAQGSGGLSGWDISNFDHDGDDTDDDGHTDGSGTMAGSVRRRWIALKASLTASIFRR
ncbi:hypothetical protein KVR01_001311 [Diaporthe batatas]|uniref:uncharacterized protein n=1 Tax=Diaporthe batatas TaxID=748121 RepID=UPI001D055FE6|nr:uncharacterized protein KVR01_001311 [Diaporthe batatas]KAG8168562.1 hypothetical protein KVR01_001311 [Diaporthe batatas]